MADERPTDLAPLRASDATKRRVVGAALREIRELEARGIPGMLADAFAWPARLAPLILPAAAAVWLVLLIGGRGLEPSAPPPAAAAARVDPGILTSAWGLEGPAGDAADASPDELLATFAETSP
ncbi:MAG: hypothetical protein PVF05_08085 [Gemmatimonadales bacterium]|jgi:hypothetical protein